MERLKLTLKHSYVGKMQTLINVFGNNNLLIDNFFDYHTPPDKKRRKLEMIGILSCGRVFTNCYWIVRNN